MKALLVGLVLLLAMALLVVGWLIALPSVGKYVLIGVLVVALVVGLLVQLPDMRRYLRIRSM